METNYYSIAETFTDELIIEKSRFITHLFPTDTLEEAKAVIVQMKKTYADASHNCSAYIIQQDTLLQKANDDGEPSGTAGMPMLQALSQREMLNITAVVTRYFGGIKLGAGGLIRAYSHAVLNALDAVPLMTYKTFVDVTLSITYDELKSIYFLQEKTELFTIENMDYDTAITLTLSLEIANLTLLEEQLQAQLLRQVDLIQKEKIVKKIPII